jgi:hypothetical protein
MGDVIRKDAAAGDIIADARTTVINAQAKRGTWQSTTEEKLSAGLAAVAVLEAKLSTLSQQAEPLIAAIHVIDDVADPFIGKLSDDAWNLLGRPSADPFYDLLFPGGISVYTDGPDEEQPARMELLASLLETHIHPRLDKEFAAHSAAELRKMASKYQAALDAARPLRLQIQIYTKTRMILARGLQLSLASLKRRLKSDGFTETDIHTVIPDRPRNTTHATTTAATTQTTATPTPAPVSTISLVPSNNDSPK